MKKLISILLALVMLLALNTTVFAASPQITVTDERVYDVYQIFTGDLSDKTLSNIKWGKNGTGTTGTAVDEATLTALANVNGSGKTDAEKLAVIEQYVNLSSEKFGQVKAGSPLTAAPGYYLFKDVTVLAAGQERSEYVVQLVGDTTVTAKAGSPVPDKKVKEKNDSTGVESDWQDSASYDVNDDVPFMLSGTVSDKLDNFNTYYYCFKDTLSKGLTLNADSIKVYVAGHESTPFAKDTDYTVTSTTATDGTTTFEVKFTDLKGKANVTAGCKIVVEYTAKLNDQAVMGSAGNPNTLKIEYSNDPNGDSKGETVDKEVKVYTFKLIVNKVDVESKPLTVAGFTLYKKIKNGETENWVAVGAEQKGENMTTFTWERLDAGDYKLVETTTPAGYNTMADKEFTITDSYKNDENGVKIELETLIAGTGFTSDLTAGSVTTSIVNNKGTVLPETGGAGTKAMIAVGSFLALAAVVFLVTRRKMSVYED